MAAPKKTTKAGEPKVGDVGAHIRRLQAERGLYVSGTWSHADAAAAQEKR